MLSVEKARECLGKSKTELQDEQVEEIRDALYQIVYVLVNQFTALNNALLSLNDIIYQIKNMEANLSRQMKAFNDNMGNICPLCDQPIKKGHKHEV